MLFYLAFLLSFLVTIGVTPVLIRKFSAAGITGRDVNKPGKPKVPEMGGLAVVAGVVATSLVLIGLSTFTEFGSGMNLVTYLAALNTLLIVAVIGIFDDLVSMRQSVKAILPIAASVPLIAIAAGYPHIYIPFLGDLYLPYIYPLILIPIGITGASNATNMLAGFNGLEAGMGLISCAGLSLIALEKGNTTSLLLLLSMAGALAAFLFYNRYPSRIFPGDVGTLSIGATIACAVIIGNFELAGVIVIMPYFFDFLIKAANRMPKEINYISLSNGKIVQKRVVGLPTLVMSLTSGISERALVSLLWLVEVVFVLIAIIVV